MIDLAEDEDAAFNIDPSALQAAVNISIDRITTRSTADCTRLMLWCQSFEDLARVAGLTGVTVETLRGRLSPFPDHESGEYRFRRRDVWSYVTWTRQSLSEYSFVRSQNHVVVSTRSVELRPTEGQDWRNEDIDSVARLLTAAFFTQHM